MKKNKNGETEVPKWFPLGLKNWHLGSKLIWGWRDYGKRYCDYGKRYGGRAQGKVYFLNGDEKKEKTANINP